MEFNLREWKMEDIEDVFKVANNKKIAANLRNSFPSPYTHEDAKEYIDACIKNADQHWYARAIVVEGRAVGSIGIHFGTDVYEKTGELGYWLAEEYWGLGIVTRAIQQICKEVFKDYDIARIYAEPFEYNIGSRKVLEKAGFTYEGTMKNGVYKEGKLFGYCMYALYKEEF